MVPSVTARVFMFTSYQVTYTERNLSDASQTFLTFTSIMVITVYM